MPGFDGSGPRGMGPRTGWGRGFCAPGTGGAGGYGFYGGYAGRGLGRGGAPWGGGRGRAWGGGWGRGRGWAGPVPAAWGSASPGYAPQGAAAPSWTPQQERDFLMNQAAAIERDLEQIRGRLAELDTPAAQPE